MVVLTSMMRDKSRTGRKAMSDTVTVTADGRLIVDAKKLFAKKHMRETLISIRQKTIVGKGTAR